MSQEIPQSNALSEASPDSLAEFLSRDPFTFQRQDRDRVVALLRDQRARWEAAEASGATKIKGVKAGAKTLITGAAAEDLGL